MKLMEDNKRIKSQEDRVNYLLEKLYRERLRAKEEKDELRKRREKLRRREEAHQYDRKLLLQE